MKLHHLLLVIPFILFSCGNSKTITDRADIKKESPKRILKKHAKSNFDQQTLRADLKVNLKRSGRSQNMNVKLRFEKDTIIWLSGTVFGFPVAKAIITPSRVSYYEKLNKTYFDGDYTQINNLLGAELDFSMLQNLLLGDAVFEMNPKEYNSSIDEQAHLLTPKQQNNIAELLFWIHPINYKIEKQEIRKFDSDEFLSVAYKNYQNINETSIPGNLDIKVKAINNDAEIRMQFKSVKLNEELSFPYKIPSGYKRVLK